MSLVLIFSKEYLIKSGITTRSKLTFFQDISTGQSINGVDMISARSHHSCEKIVVNDKVKLFVIGGLTEGNEWIKTTEFYDFETNQWNEGTFIRYLRVGRFLTILLLYLHLKSLLKPSNI